MTQSTNTLYNVQSVHGIIRIYNTTNIIRLTFSPISGLIVNILTKI